MYGRTEELSSSFSLLIINQADAIPFTVGISGVRRVLCASDELLGDVLKVRGWREIETRCGCKGFS